MIALILAAGRGSRLRELTDGKPKCLVRLAGKALLRWQYDALRAAGARDVLVVRGYLAECLVPEAVDLPPEAFATVGNPHWAQSNMLSSLLCAGPWLEAAFAAGETAAVISYADIVYPAGHVRALCEQAGDAPVALTYDTAWEALWRIRFADPLSDAESFACRDGLLCDIGRKPQGLADIQGQYMGLLRITPAGWREMLAACGALGDAVARTDMTGFLRVLMARQVPVAAVPVRGGWCEVDSQEDLRAYEACLTRGNWQHDWRGEAASGRQAQERRLGAAQNTEQASPEWPGAGTRYRRTATTGRE
ncbi:MAG TPA: phosphocholine cytidylyltransferase family protein [Candidatus Desulfovibrio intestinavium]|uniref:Phosphocholine cytidylyltransferase family protein n=1 Tax=Candidatus Desulfovibrio intestinavium TaxID=2838534 RepID=A0A9D2HMY8_9BACT|nr:phosphocholine cytidylyltransferase family protein [Candidatus Desulfovibrio intestinavium]